MSELIKQTNQNNCLVAKELKMRGGGKTVKNRGLRARYSWDARWLFCKTFGKELHIDPSHCASVVYVVLESAGLV